MSVHYRLRQGGKARRLYQRFCHGSMDGTNDREKLMYNLQNGFCCGSCFENINSCLCRNAVPDGPFSCKMFHSFLWIWDYIAREQTWLISDNGRWLIDSLISLLNIRKYHCNRRRQNPRRVSNSNRYRPNKRTPPHLKHKTQKFQNNSAEDAGNLTLIKIKIMTGQGQFGALEGARRHSPFSWMVWNDCFNCRKTPIGFDWATWMKYFSASALMLLFWSTFCNTRNGL